MGGLLWHVPVYHISKKAKKLQALISACNCIKHSKQVLELQVLKPPTVFGNLIIISHYNFNYFCGLGYCSPITWSISVSTKWNIGNHKLDFQSTKVVKLPTVFGNLIIIPHYNFNYFCGLEYCSCFFWLISDFMSWVSGKSEPDCQFNCDNFMEQKFWQILYDHNSLYILLTIISTDANCKWLW